ncbi:hypothetical protein [Leucobacter luti]|uniref:Uncharacterized protein n=1 Tax=Leucobacter luti TaxID=340320 RepID=A0A4R6RS94_9MICO|nr:hypothetical protein [Leucobacter luti]MCW2289480.1 hypothetical protein [Leucobacter luti]QYM74758.1 hypothetical protein K1X41_08365 [Leucobacter luti]TCK33909.1 hypothetical protein EDF60_3081 [Leucobacter luti]TDP89125.1 hypothetical protein EDF62_3446 [Leucobacter luti]
MARVEVHRDRVVIRLTNAERVASLRRRDITLDRAAITSAVITDDPWVWLRGVRSPGTHIPGALASGTWRSFAGRDFVLARKGREAVVIDLETSQDAAEDRGWVGEYDPFARVILSTTHAAELVRALRLDDGEGGITVDTDR